MTQVAGRASATAVRRGLRGGPLARGLPPLSPRSPHSGLPALQQREGYRRPLPGSRHQVQRALPRWSPHLGQRSTSRPRRTAHPARAFALRGADLRAAGPCASLSPRASSLLQSCAVPFYPRVSCPWHRVRLLQAPGWPPGLRAVGRSGTGRPPERARLSRTRPPARLLHPLGTHLSPPQLSPREPREGREVWPGRDPCTPSRELSPAGPRPCPPCAPLGARLRAPDSPSAAFPSGSRRSLARRSSERLLKFLAPPPGLLLTPNPSRTTALRSPAPALAGRGRTALGASRS